MTTEVRLPKRRYPKPAPTDTAIMIHPLYVMKMSLFLVRHSTIKHLEPTDREHLHDHESVKVLGPIEYRLDDMGPPRDVVSVLS